MVHQLEKKDVSWSGRFSEPVEKSVQDYTSSVNFDRKLALKDIKASLAHAEMLATRKIITKNDFKCICKGFKIIEKEIVAGKFQWRVELEDVHMNIEARLTSLIGEPGKKLHTGRSRNDQIATDIRLWLRDEIDFIVFKFFELRLGLVGQAEKHFDLMLPGYTHLQVAQPVTFGHHLLAYDEMFSRDCERLLQIRARVNKLPLGSAALAGTSFDIDREIVAKLLGFDGLCENSIDAVSDRDFAIELSSALSLVMIHISRLSEEMILWMSGGFDFIKLPDKFCTGSSIMPQKKNPDVPELARGKSGRVIGNLVSLLVLMKGQPLAYNKDNQEDKEPLFDSVETVKSTLSIFAEMIPNIEVHKDNMIAALEKDYPTATDLADYLVRRNLSFRDSHEIVSKIVSYAIKQNQKLEMIPLKVLQQFSKLIREDVYSYITIGGSILSRKHIGGTSSKQVKKTARLKKTRILKQLRTLNV